MPLLRLLLPALACGSAAALLPPLLDVGGGRAGLPRLYDGWLDDQLGRQAAAALARAVRAGRDRIEIQFPPVPNVEEVRFGTPLNQKFGKKVVAPDLGVPGGYAPGSNVSRQLLAYANVYWAKRLAGAARGGLLGGFGGGGAGGGVAVLSSEPVAVKEIAKKGDIATLAPLGRQSAAAPAAGTVILVNPGGEETWERLRASCGSPRTCVVLNNAYSTTYNLGNRAGYEEAYYLKRISKGWVFRSFPGPWQAYLEGPDGRVELLRSYPQKPELAEVATLVREESFKRYAVGNDRWMRGRL